MDIKERRKELKLTQMALAKACRVSIPTIQAWERGVSTPRRENLERLRVVLGVDKEENQVE